MELAISGFSIHVAFGHIDLGLSRWKGGGGDAETLAGNCKDLWLPAWPSSD